MPLGFFSDFSKSSISFKSDIEIPLSPCGPLEKNDHGDDNNSSYCNRNRSKSCYDLSREKTWQVRDIEAQKSMLVLKKFKKCIHHRAEAKGLIEEQGQHIELKDENKLMQSHSINRLLKQKTSRNIINNNFSYKKRQSEIKSNKPWNAEKNSHKLVLTNEVSRWSIASPYSHFQPVCNPHWLKKSQQKLPWYNETYQAQAGPWLSVRASELPYNLFTTEILFRWKRKGSRYWMITRFIIATSIILSLFFINVIFQDDLYTVGNVDTLFDWFQYISAPLNDWISKHDTGRHLCTFFASLCMDMLFLLTWVQWIILGDSFRLVIAFVLFYGVRGFVRLLCLFPFPSNYAWEIPSFYGINIPSLVVPYQPSDDFFFSGHVGCCVLTLLEHYHYRFWLGVLLSICVTLVQFTLLLITRCHYGIDMFIGAIIASWCHLLAQKLTRPVDQWLCFPPRPVVQQATKISEERVRPEEEHTVVDVTPAAICQPNANFL